MTQKILETPKIWLSLDDCESIYNDFAPRLSFIEPIPSFNSRFPDKLESILSSVSQTYGGEYLNNSILEVSASYFNQIIRGHPFRNGNKRMACLFTHMFLLSNEIELTLSFEEFFHFAIYVARSSEKGKKSDETKGLCTKIIRDFTKDFNPSL